HFFSTTLDAFYGALAMLGADYDYFAPALLWELHKYTKKRDEEESRFLQPFHDYSKQLDGVVKGQLNGHSFSYFDMDARVKRALLTKLQIRNWSDMKEFYDLLGLRLVVGNQHEVLAAVALVEGALRVHEAEALLNPDVSYYFRVDHIEEK